VQGTVGSGGREGLFDDVIGRGFVLLIDGSADGALPEGGRGAFEAIGGRIAGLGDDVRDLDGRMTGWLRAHGAAAVIVRPDYYVFGAVASPADVPLLIDDLLTQLRPGGRAAPPPSRETEEDHVHH
jgi:flavoprotein hydroxylase